MSSCPAAHSPPERAASAPPPTPRSWPASPLTGHLPGSPQPRWTSGWGPGYFTPEAARALLEREIFPAQASRLSGPDQGLGQYEDTVGYKLANNDLTSAEADEIVRSW